MILLITDDEYNLSLVPSEGFSRVDSSTPVKVGQIQIKEGGFTFLDGFYRDFVISLLSILIRSW